MFTVAEINFPAQLAELRHVWRSLWERTPQASFLQTREWLESYLFHDAMADDLRVLVVATKGRPVGIVPLMVKRVRSRFGTVRMLTYPLDDSARTRPRRCWARCNTSPIRRAIGT
jgi:CelD/BcsL family acetyltransferase involved in cellulose biosynthesis